MPFGQFSSCRARVSVDNPKSLYTNDDLISGTLLVTLTKEISIKEISISLRCVEEILMSRRQNNMSRSNFMQCVHFEQKIVLFPPPELSASHTAHGAAVYTLQSGEYEYPFSLKFPSDASHLETFKFDSDTMIGWHVKARVLKSGLLNTDTHATFTVHFVPNRAVVFQHLAHQMRHEFPTRVLQFKAHDSDYVPSLRSRFSNKHRSAANIDFAISIPRLGLLQHPYDAGIIMTLTPCEPGMVKLEKLKISLECIDMAGDEMVPRACVTRYELLRLEHLGLVLDHCTTLSDIQAIANGDPHLYIEENIVGSFRAKFMTRQISLLITMEFSSANYVKHTSTRRASYEVNLAPRSLPDAERVLLEARQNRRMRMERRARRSSEEQLPRYEVRRVVSPNMPPPYVASTFDTVTTAS